MFPRLSHSLSPSPGTLQVGGGFRHQGSDYLCQQCWSVLCSQPWPAEQAAPGAGGTAACSPMQLGGGAQRAAPPAAGQNGALGLPPTAPLPLPHQPAFGSHPGHPGVLSAAAAAASHAALQRRCQSVADLQLALAGSRPARPSGWQPASMPEAPAILGSADDPRWGALAMAASAPDYHRTRSGAQRLQQMAVSGSAPVFSPLELKNMMDESSLEIFESQSHLLDPETRLQLQVGGGGGWVDGLAGAQGAAGGRIGGRPSVCKRPGVGTYTAAWQTLLQERCSQWLLCPQPGVRLTLFLGGRRSVRPARTRAICNVPAPLLTHCCRSSGNTWSGRTVWRSRGPCGPRWSAQTAPAAAAARRTWPPFGRCGQRGRHWQEWMHAGVLLLGVGLRLCPGGAGC